MKTSERKTVEVKKNVAEMYIRKDEILDRKTFRKRIKQFKGFQGRKYKNQKLSEQKKEIQ